MAKHRDKLIDFAIFSSGRELYGYADVTLPDIEFSFRDLQNYTTLKLAIAVYRINLCFRDLQNYM